MKICIIGVGYVGLSSALLFSQKHEVVAYDIDKEKIALLKNKESPIHEKDIEEFLLRKDINFRATDNFNDALDHATFSIICVPTNFDNKKNRFETEIVEKTIENILSINPNCGIVIKSTVPIGFSKEIQEKQSNKNIFHVPEFLREGNSLFDSLYPSRLIIGSRSDLALMYVDLVQECILKNNLDIILTNNDEAEAIKLFSNTYLAMRVAFFNELDSFSQFKGLNSLDIINGLGQDPRIGKEYNNPSFGFGGYCLPKDVQQASSNMKDIQSNVIDAITLSNENRKKFLANLIMNTSASIIGVYRLTMKQGSDNFRDSAIKDIIKILSANNREIIVYEPLLKEAISDQFTLVKDFKEFVTNSELILVNRMDDEISPYKDKIFTRDLFREN